jgi:hypothetical protein
MDTILRTVTLAVALTVASPAIAQQAGASAQQGAGSTPAPRAAPAGAPRTPPPEAFAACSGKAAGAACTFQHKDRTETGSCFTPDPAQPVACKPVRPPRDEPAPNAR